MSGGATRSVVLAIAMLTTASAFGQESQFASDLRREGQDIRESCGNGFSAKSLVGCVIVLATDDPFHVAFGNLAPQNGMGFGLAFAEHYTPNERWRISWNADGVVAPSGSWRTGAYMKFIYRPPSPIIVVRPAGTGTAPSAPRVTITDYPVLNVYAQAISLNTLAVEAGNTPFSERQTIVGANVIYPIAPLRPLRAAFVGAINGRWLTVRDTTIEASQQLSFAQFGEGIRLRPSLNERLRLNYLVELQQFAASADTNASFHRWTLDLKHEVPLYRNVSSLSAKDTNGPDECFQSVGSPGCPPVSYSRNLEGSIGFRVLTTKSVAGTGGSVPFYFQPTLGGSDINGQRLLAAFDDYRFRGPNLLALQESIEHSIWGPIGAYFLAEQGKVTQAAEGLGFGDLARSYAVGITVRAGGFPLVNLTFAWGAEGHHIITTIDSTLLGGSGRPSLY
jgi:hypothetical protein